MALELPKRSIVRVFKDSDYEIVEVSVTQVREKPNVPTRKC